MDPKQWVDEKYYVLDCQYLVNSERPTIREDLGEQRSNWPDLILAARKGSVKK